MRFELRFALRYIFSKRSFNFITVISIISFIGIAIGVSAIIIVLSIFNGFRDFTEQQLIGFDPHIRIAKFKTNKQELSSIKQLLAEIDNIKSISLTEEARVVGSAKGKIFVFNLIKINPNEFNEFYNLNKYIVNGNNLINNSTGLAKIVIGVGISNKLNLAPGDTLEIITPKDIESSIKFFSLPKSYKFIVSGIFQTNVNDFDFTIAFTGTQSVISDKKTIKYLNLKVKDLNQIETVAKQIQIILPDSQVLTWKDLHKDLFKIMNFERYFSTIILSLIILIAVFNVLSSLTMTVIEKRRDIGILSSIGATNKQIKNIFLIQGILIGLMSTITGIILGLLFCYGQINFQWFKLSSNNFLISAIPIKIQVFDILIASIISLIFTFIASIYPAKKAVKSITIENIREE